MKFRFLVLVAFFLPAISHAQVLFSEIAWMGTLEDANNEWIEIYNFSSTPTDLTGWTLSDGNSLNIELSGTMPPHGVFLLERTDDTSVPEVTASIIYTGALSNTGATLTIKDAGGQTVDSVVGGENWVNIGGNNEYKYTAQSTRTGTWVTGTPTPGLPNIESDTEIPGGNEDNGGDLPKVTKTSTSGGSSSARNKIKEPEIPQVLSLKISAPKIAYVNQSVSFEPLPTGVGKTTLNSLKYLWNFGDTDTSESKTPAHVYTHAGDYVVVVEAQFAKQIAQARHEIKVLPVALRIVPTPSGDVMLINESSQEMNLEGFMLKGSLAFTFPRLSILKAGGSITIPKAKFGMSANNLALYDTQKTLVTSNFPSPSTQVSEVAYSAPKNSYTVPTATSQVSLTDTAEVEEAISTEESPQVIRVGEVTTQPEPGLVARFFKKLGSFFRL